VLQFSFALVPYFLGRVLLADRAAQLGGSWWSLLLAHVGSAFIWASIFVEPQRALLHGAAYLLYALAMLPIAWTVWRMFRTGIRTLEQRLATEQTIDNGAFDVAASD
jgi:hypothetical protein